MPKRAGRECLRNAFGEPVGMRYVPPAFKNEQIP